MADAPLRWDAIPGYYAIPPGWKLPPIPEGTQFVYVNPNDIRHLLKEEFEPQGMKDLLLLGVLGNLRDEHSTPVRWWRGVPPRMVVYYATEPDCGGGYNMVPLGEPDPATLHEWVKFETS